MIYFLGVLNQVDCLRCFAHRTDDFVVTLVADEDDGVPLLGKLDGFEVDFRHQWTSRVDGEKLPFLRDTTDFW